MVDSAGRDLFNKLPCTLTNCASFTPCSLRSTPADTKRRRSLTRDALLTLLRALVITSVDYCCSVLTGVYGALLQRLQSALNAAARLVFSVRRSEHTTPLLRELHWLIVPERIQNVDDLQHVIDGVKRKVIGDGIDQ